MADSKRVLTIDTFGAPNPHTVVTDCESLRELYRTFETAGTNRLLGLVGCYFVAPQVRACRGRGCWRIEERRWGVVSSLSTINAARYNDFRGWGWWLCFMCPWLPRGCGLVAACLSGVYRVYMACCRMVAAWLRRVAQCMCGASRGWCVGHRR